MLSDCIKCHGDGQRCPRSSWYLDVSLTNLFADNQFADRRFTDNISLTLVSAVAILSSFIIDLFSQRIVLSAKCVLSANWFVSETSLKHPLNAVTFALSHFTALHGMHTRSSDENSVRLYVCQTRAL